MAYYGGKIFNQLLNQIVTNGLVISLDAGNPLSYPGSGTTWTDLSGNGNNGTLNGSTSYSAQGGGSLYFGVGNDYISFASYTRPSQTLANGFTWNIWTNPLRNGDGDILMGNRQPSLADFTKLTTNNMEYYPTNLGGAIPLSSWINICVVKDGANLYYYRNGVLYASNVTSQTKTSQPFYIGGDPAENTYLYGRIADVQVYDRALTLSEVTQNFNAFRERFGI